MRLGSVSVPYLALLTILSFALALRGWRQLFAVPALAFTLTPFVIDVYHQS